MRLTEKQQQMLDGEYGRGTQRSIEMLIRVGEVFDAADMVPVRSSHLVIPEMSLFFNNEAAEWGREITRPLMEDVKRFAVPSTTNALMLDLEKADALRIPRSFVKEMKQTFDESKAEYEGRGAIPNYSCTPFFDFFYRRGDHLGGAESVQILLNNSFNGARVNRETGATALAVAVTGVTPRYGLHLKENRYGQVLIEIDRELTGEKLNDADYNAIGYYVGRVAVDRIPVFRGLPRDMDETDCKYLCVPLAVSAGIGLIHVEGVTPEADSLEMAFGGRKPKDRFVIGKKELKSSYERLNTAKGEKMDYVALGCPHCSLNELREIAALLEGKTVNPNVVLLVATSTIKYKLGQQMGIVETIESSGGVVVSGMCPGSTIFGRYGKELGVRTVATNSAKNAHYIGAHSGGCVGTHFGSMRQCIEAALTGRWRS
jgi:predicted aconitase